MMGGPPITDMARTLVDHGVNLTDDRAVIMCLVAHYHASVVGPNLDRAIELARAIETARFDGLLSVVSAIMGPAA